MVETTTGVLCVTREEQVHIPHPAVTLGVAEETWVVVGESLQETSNKDKKLVLIIPTAAVIIGGE